MIQRGEAASSENLVVDLGGVVRMLVSNRTQTGLAGRLHSGEHCIVTGCPWAWRRNSCNSADAPARSARATITLGASRLILATHQRQMRALLGKKPDLTLKELRATLALECSRRYAEARSKVFQKRRFRDG